MSPDSEDRPAGEMLYRRLEVAPAASREEIIRAYRRLAHDVHPDAHPEDPEAARRFREITEAYDVLSDPESRARYDGSARAAPRQGAGTSPPFAAPPVVIGASRPWMGAAPLWAGPAHVEPSGTMPRSPEVAVSDQPPPSDQWLTEVTRIIREMMGSRWWS